MRFGNNETPPQEWRDGIIVKLPKKGDLGDCNNWRGITLLTPFGKLLHHPFEENEN